MATAINRFAKERNLPTDFESDRINSLRTAQSNADALFHAIETNGGLIRPGVTESRLNEEIFKLAEQMYGIRKYWHKRIVRAGETPFSRTTTIRQT